jgi:hypothetical protein
MAADHPGSCSQRFLIVPAGYASGAADLALVVEKVDLINDHGRPAVQTRTIKLSHSPTAHSAVASETTQGNEVRGFDRLVLSACGPTT